MNEQKIPIPAMLYNVAVGGHVTNAQQIIDENENKEQSRINAEVKKTLGEGGSVNNRINQAKTEIIGSASTNGNTLKKIEDRVSSLESAVNNGGNIDIRIETAVNIEKTRAQSAENIINERVDNLESIVGTNNSVDFRIEAAKSEIKGDATSSYDTLGKAEVKIKDNAVAISAESSRAKAEEEQLRILYNNLQQSQPIPVTELPVTGEKGKIYRLAGTINYSDYMWNGTQFVKMATYDNAIDGKPIEGSENLVKSGGIFDSINDLNIAIAAEKNRAETAEQSIMFDVSAHNNGAVFESLQVLLDSSNLSTLIPISVRHGGMSIRFIQGSEQSSDNKYVQFRYISDVVTGSPNPFLDESNWQGVDIEPMAGSKNLVESGGVYKYLYGLLYETINKPSEEEINNKILRTDGTTIPVEGQHITDYIKVYDNTIFSAYGLFLNNYNGFTGFCVYDINMTLLGIGGSASLTDLYIKDYNIKEHFPQAAYIRFTLASPGSYVIIGISNSIYKEIQQIKLLATSIDFKYSELTPNNTILLQDGTTLINGAATDYYTSDFVEIDDYSTLEGYLVFAITDRYAGYCVYDEQKNFIGCGGSLSSENYYIVRFNIKQQYPNAKYIRITLSADNQAWAAITREKLVSDMYHEILDINSNIEDIKKFLQPEYTTTLITVKADGTIGTDCDFTDIASAMDSITDNSKIKQYIVYVKNGTYDITGVNYLGFKNYVTVRGESIEGVVVRNSTQTEDQSVVCFDPAKYGNNIIDYATIENMTLRIYGGKCCVHIDGNSIKSGGKILIRNIHFINENEDSSRNRGGVNCGLNGGQTVEIESCYGNVLAYAHSRINPSTYLAPNYFIFKNCHLNYIGYYDLNDKVENGGHNHLIVNGCICDYIGIGVGYQAVVTTYNSIAYEIGNDNKFNWVYIYGQGSIIGYDDWFIKYPICSSIHRIAENHTGSTIIKDTFVSVVRSEYNGVPSPDNAQPSYRYNIVPYNGGELFGVAMEDIADGESGIIQVEGKILIPDNSYTAGQYITLNENGSPVVGTKENAIGIVTDANQQYLGTLVLLKKRDYDYIL